MQQVLLPCRALNCNIINVYFTEILAITENLVHLHHYLECGWHIVQLKWHHPELIAAKGRSEGHLFSRLFGHWNLPISLHQIQCGYELGRTHTLQHFLYTGHGVRIEFGHLVEFSVVQTKAHIAVLFLY